MSGVPFLLKDINLYSDDMPTRNGSRYFAGESSRSDSVMVEKWRAAGLSILGKTNTPEFGASYTTEPSAYGRCVNPWHPHITVGGSSGGAAAAVASGMVPLAHATDSAGSIRIPAACCGLYGFKPTAGLNPAGPHFKDIAHGLNSDHVLTRSVRDSAASLDVTSSYTGAAFLDRLSDPVGKLKVAATIHAADGAPAGANQIAAVEKTIEMLRDLRHDVTLLPASPFLPIGDWFDALWIDDIRTLVARRQAETGVAPGADDLEPRSWAALRRSLPDVDDAIRSKEHLAKAFLDVFDICDILLTPTLAADPASLDSLSEAEGARGWVRACAAFSVMANVTGQPAASLPLPGNPVPTGVQIMAAPYRDLLVLQLSRQLEPMFDWAAAHRAHWISLAARFPFPAG